MASNLTKAGAIALLISTTAAQAQDDPPPAVDDGDSFTVGVGVGYAPSYEGSDDYNVIPAAAVRGKVSGFNFYMRGTALYVDLVPEGPAETVDFSAGAIFSVRLNRTSRIKDEQVEALGELDAAIELGGFVGIAKTGVVTSAYDNLGFRVSYLRDVGDTHDSYIVSPSIEYGTPLSIDTYVGLSVSADYVGDGYAQTYFGVTPAGAAASGLAPYSPDGGLKSVGVGLLGSYALSGDVRRGLSLFAIGNYSRLLGDFADSPIVADAGDADQWFGAVGLAYTF